jgi:hypothetical protein
VTERNMDPTAEWPRILRPLVRRRWMPARYRRDSGYSYFILVLILLGPLAAVLTLIAAPIWLTYLGVRWVLRRVGAPDEPA